MDEHTPATDEPSADEAPGAVSSLDAILEEVLETGDVRKGRPLPLGVHLQNGGANFAIFSRHATRIWLEFYDAPEDAAPSRRIELDAEGHQTGDIWHVWVSGVRPGQLYGYRAEGPYRPEEGHRFNPHKLLIDPYAGAITHLEAWDFALARGYEAGDPEQDLSFSTSDNAHRTPKCVVTENHFDWEGDHRLRRPYSETVIYELHVRGFTRHPSAGVEHPGAFRGLTEKIPYLKELGVTAVELMPVQEFNEHELARVNPITGEPLRNYWGYNPAAFMAPNGHYAWSGNCGQQEVEFKEMVKAFHRAGLEVILDVVFNHTAEGNELGPTFSWRGLDNAIYYLLAEDRRFYMDYTGTGNTVKADHPVVRDLILDALRYWVVEMHVDGFRFDLASVLGRDQEGHLLADPPLLERIAEDPILRDVKLIAEAWDTAGAYQVGSFYKRRWADWNGRFRDDVRRFWRGDKGFRGHLASRLCGSADLYEGSGRGPEASINYVACHDGFTLSDLVSYVRKHNEMNGEGNRDGTDANYSANYGLEGPTKDPAIEAVRECQIKNLLLTLFLSRGVPMLLGGDEFRRTQQGNNNAYCQDNEISWVDWTLKEEHEGLFRFVQSLIAFRGEQVVLHQDAFYTDADIQWYDADGQAPDWADAAARTLACHIHGHDGGPDLFLLFNAETEERTFALPPAPEGISWKRKIDTAREAPDDFCEAGQEVSLEVPWSYTLAGRSAVVLVATA